MSHVLHRPLLLLSMLGTGLFLHAQTTPGSQRALRLGDRAYRQGDLPAAVQQYERTKEEAQGAYNLGNAYYKMDSAALAQRSYESAAAMAKSRQDQARAYHNLGNSYLKQGLAKEAVQAYKEALKREPGDADTRYNLAYAQKKLRQEEEKQDQDKDKKEQDDQQKDNKEQDPKDPKKDDQKGPDGKPRPKPGQIDEKDAQRMLDAMQQQEKETQEKLREQVPVRPRTPIDKDW